MVQWIDGTLREIDVSWSQVANRLASGWTLKQWAEQDPQWPTLGAEADEDIAAGRVSEPMESDEFFDSL